MRVLKNITKIKLGDKKHLLVAGVIFIALAGVIGYWFMKAGTSPKELKAENNKIQESMRTAVVTGGMDSARLANIEASRRVGKYTEALAELDAILAEPNLSDSDKRTLHSIRGPICLQVKDFKCANEFIAQFNNIVPFDYHFLVEAARMAKSENKSEIARQYYAQALTEIDKQGGEDLVKKLNQSVEVPLDYTEIKNGATN